MQGRRIIVASWISDALFALTAVPHALGVDGFEGPSIGMAFTLFGVSLVVWPWVFAVAFVRSSQGDDLVVASIFLTVGDAPTEVRRQLFTALGVSVALCAATAVANPFGVLVPMLPLGLVGLWAVRHGAFPPRSDAPRGR
ncbi:MAG: hypothetical protein WD598_07315 [Acidimicrobiia bacterium]